MHFNHALRARGRCGKLRERYRRSIRGDRRGYRDQVDAAEAARRGLSKRFRFSPRILRRYRSRSLPQLTRAPGARDRNAFLQPCSDDAARRDYPSAADFGCGLRKDHRTDQVNRQDSADLEG